MSEEQTSNHRPQNTDDAQQNKEQPVNNENAAENISSKEIIVETGQLITKNMETHAHELHKAPGHGWKHYFFEFFMLFLAVFCGFLAENQREKIVEHEREEKYMVTLVEDLEIDTANMGKLKRSIDQSFSRKDSLNKYIHPPISEENITKYYEESWVAPRIKSYNYNDRTVEQLRSSGNYRLIRNKDITDSLIAYDIRMRGTFSKNYDVLYQSRLKLIDLQSDILDGLALNYFDKNDNLMIDSLKKNKLWPLHLLTNDSKILFRYYNSCIAHLRFGRDLETWINRMTIEATNLITIVKKEYKLK